MPPPYKLCCCVDVSFYSRYRCRCVCLLTLQGGLGQHDHGSSMSCILTAFLWKTVVSAAVQLPKTDDTDQSHYNKIYLA